MRECLKYLQISEVLLAIAKLSLFLVYLDCYIKQRLPSIQCLELVFVPFCFRFNRV